MYTNLLLFLRVGDFGNSLLLPIYGRNGHTITVNKDPSKMFFLGL